MWTNSSNLNMINAAGAMRVIGGGSGGAVATDAIWDAAGDLAVGSGANTAAKLAKGNDGENLRMVSGAVAWSGVGSLIACSVYAPGTPAAKVQTSATQGDADATNLIVAFTAPASGNILVRLTGSARIDSGAAAGNRAAWGLRESTTDVAGPTYVMYIEALLGANKLVSTSVAYYLTGISAGAHTYKWAIAGGGATNGGMYVGVLYPAVMEVWAL